MQRRTRLVLTGALVFLAGLVLLFPARVAYQWFMPDTVRLSGISGTVWRGSAAAGTFGGFYAGNLSWRFRPTALLTGKAGYAVSAEPAGGSLESEVALAPGGSVHLANLRAGVSLAALGGALVGAAGQIDLQFETLVVVDGWPLRATGTAEVHDLAVPMLAPVPLGDYRAAFETVENVVTARFEDMAGVLELAGTLELQPDRSYLLSGRVRTTNETPAEVVQQLQLLGEPDAEGMRTFRFEGAL